MEAHIKENGIKIIEVVKENLYGVIKINILETG